MASATSRRTMTREEVEAIRPDQVRNVLATNGIFTDGYPIVYDHEKSKSVWIVDAVTGRSILDCASFFATLALGHNHPKLQDKGFTSRLGTLAVHNPPNADFYTVEMAQYVATFSRVLMPPEFVHMFLISGGSPAVGNAIKCAVDWKVRKNMIAGHPVPECGKKIVYFENAFHGRTGFSLSATKSTLHKYQYFPRFDWIAVRGPPCSSEQLPSDEMVREEARALKDVHDAVAAADGDVAAIIIEPIQGEGGDVHWRLPFIAGLRSIADDLDVLLIYDEVQTGAGTTGHRWCFEHWGNAAVPDIIAFGKKTQVCGFIATARIDQVPDNVFHVSGRLDSTWGGNMTDMVRGRRILEVIEEDGLIQNAAVVGDYFVVELRKLATEYPQVTRVRGCGFFIAATLPTPEDRAKFVSLLFSNGMLVLSCGKCSFRLRPALIFTRDDAQKACEIIRKVLEQLYGDAN